MVWALRSPGVMPHPGVGAQSVSLKVQCLGGQKFLSWASGWDLCSQSIVGSG